MPSYVIVGASRGLGVSTGLTSISVSEADQHTVRMAPSIEQRLEQYRHRLSSFRQPGPSQT